MKNKQIIQSLSKHLFWDVDIQSIDEKKHAKYIISRVVRFGFFSDWTTILKYYGLEKIVKLATSERDIDKRSASFLSLISGTPKSSFICYTTNPSNPKHWIS